MLKFQDLRLTESSNDINRTGMKTMALESLHFSQERSEEDRNNLARIMLRNNSRGKKTA